MHASWVIAGKDLRQRLRDRSAIVTGFVAPLVLAGIMSLAFQGADDFHATFGVVDDDSGPLATAFLDVLEAPELAEIVDVETYDGAESARAAVDDLDVDAALVVPEGFSAAALGGDTTASLQVLTSIDREIAGQVATAIADGFVGQANATRLSVATAIDAGAPADEVAALAQQAAELRVPVETATQPTGDRELEAISYYAPAMAILFALFAVSFGATSFVAEEQNATLDRMAAAPVRPWVVLVGKALSVFLFASASLITVALFTSLMFGAYWGSPLATVAICLAMAAAIVSLTMLVIALARTDRQAEGLAGIIVFGLALVGGNFIQASFAPDLVRRIALVTPNGWALRGFTDLASGADTFESTLTPVLAILAFTAVVGAIAAVLARRAVVR